MASPLTVEPPLEYTGAAYTLLFSIHKTSAPPKPLSLAFAAQQKWQDNLKERASAALGVKAALHFKRNQRSLASLRTQHTNPDIYNPSAVFYLQVDVKLKVQDGPDPGQEASSRKREIERNREGGRENI